MAGSQFHSFCKNPEENPHKCIMLAYRTYALGESIGLTRIDLSRLGIRDMTANSTAVQAFRISHDFEAGRIIWLSIKRCSRAMPDMLRTSYYGRSRQRRCARLLSQLEAFATLRTAILIAPLSGSESSDEV